MKRHLRITIEQHAEGYVGSVRGLGHDIVLGEGDTTEQALADVCAALLFHLETFGLPDTWKLDTEKRRTEN